MTARGFGEQQWKNREEWILSVCGVHRYSVVRIENTDFVIFKVATLRMENRMPYT